MVIEKEEVLHGVKVVMAREWERGVIGPGEERGKVSLRGCDGK